MCQISPSCSLWKAITCGSSNQNDRTKAQMIDQPINFNCLNMDKVQFFMVFKLQVLENQRKLQNALMYQYKILCIDASLFQHSVFNQMHRMYQSITRMSRCISVKNAVFLKITQHESMHTSYVSMHNSETSKKTSLLVSQLHALFS